MEDMIFLVLKANDEKFRLILVGYDVININIAIGVFALIVDNEFYK